MRITVSLSYDSKRNLVVLLLVAGCWFTAPSGAEGRGGTASGNISLLDNLNFIKPEPSNP